MMTDKLRHFAKRGKNMPQSRKRLWAALLAVSLCAAAVLTVLQAGALHQANRTVHWSPDYEMVDILPLLQKPSRTAEEYALLYAQTGLTRIGIEDLLKAEDIPRILEIQRCYFEDYAVETSTFAPFASTQTIDGEGTFGLLRNGDLIVSSSAFFSWFRCGHAAMMADAGSQQVINAVSIGIDSALEHLSSFGSRANFMVLRPKLPAGLREQVAAYAKSNLTGLPYRLTAGLLSDKFESPITSTHCSHLVWYAYQAFGIDLDSNGGRLVTPRDLARSPLLELVQTFGFDPQRLWN